MFAAGAAVLWWRSALVQVPERIQLFADPPGYAPTSWEREPGDYSNVVSNLPDLVKALRWQSQLSKWAAICAGIAAALQAVATAFPG